MRNTVYISGAITHDPNYMKHFQDAEEKLISDIADGEYDFNSVINPAKVCFSLPLTFTHEEYLKVCMRLLELSQAIYMLNGWEKSKGAKQELEYAKFLGLPVYYEILER